MRPCQAAPAFETTMSSPPKAATTLSSALRTETALVTSQRTATPEAPIALGLARGGGPAETGPPPPAPGGANHPGGGTPDRPRRARDNGDLAGQRLIRRSVELCLLERPVLHVEHVGFGDRREAADRFRVGDGLDRGGGEIGGDAGRMGREAPAADAKPPTQAGPR